MDIKTTDSNKVSNFSISNYFEEHKKLQKKIDINSIENAIKLIESKIKEEKKIFTCGNGGSASTASHYITDWNKMITTHTGFKFRGISLCDNIGLITAYANDVNYCEIFSAQLSSILDSGDLLIAISGSGMSKNIISAVNYANSNGADTLAIVGYDGGDLIKIAKLSILIPSFDMQLCEDIHLMFGHMTMKKICNMNIKNN